MEQKKNEQKTAQILYITIMLVLLVMALAVGLVTAADRRKAPVNETSAVETTVATVRTDALKDIDHTSPSVTTKRREEPLPETSRVSEITVAEVTLASEQPVQADVEADALPTFIMPTIGDVAKKYSIDALVFSNTMEDYRTHNGIDVCAPVGEGVVAAADGIVTDIYDHPMMGYTVVVSHSGEATTVYQNLSDEIPVAIGDTVKCGEVIGAIGDSAIIEIAEEPHLHFELTVCGEYQDPLDYISVETLTVVYGE